MQFELKTLGQWSFYCVPELEALGILHGFMTKSSDSIVTDRQRSKDFTELLSATGVIIMAQEHGADVHAVERGERPGVGDGLLLVEKGVIAVIKTADCLPVMVYDADTPMAAIVHAGWRGTAKGITETAVRKMVDLGARPERLGALIGPGIGPCCYEVGGEVVGEFRRGGFSDAVFTLRNGSTFLDLKKANREVLEGQGITTIYDVNLCTACRQDLFFSARKNPHAGRQVNFVQLAR